LSESTKVGREAACDDVDEESTKGSIRLRLVETKSSQVVPGKNIGFLTCSENELSHHSFTSLYFPQTEYAFACYSIYRMVIEIAVSPNSLSTRGEIRPEPCPEEWYKPFGKVILLL